MAPQKQARPTANTAIAVALRLAYRASDEHARQLLTWLRSTHTGTEDIVLLATSPVCDTTTLDAIAQQWSRANDTDAITVLASVAWNTNTSAQTLTSLARYHHQYIRSAIASNTSTPSDVLDVLSRDPRWDIRQQVAGHHATSEATLIKLLRDTDTSVRDAAMANRHIPMDALLMFMGTSPDHLMTLAAARNPHIPSSLANEWSTHTSHLVRSLIAANPALSGNALEILSAEPRLRIQAGVASNPNISAQSAELLSSPLRALDIRASLADNKAIPLETAAALLVDPDPIVRRRAALAQTCLTPSLLAQAGLEEEHTRVLAAIATHKNSPEPLITRIILRAHRSTGTAESPIARAIAYRSENISTPVAHLIAETGDPEALSVIASRPDAPRVLITVCAKHEDAVFRRAAAVNPACPPHLLERLTHDSDSATAMIALTNPTRLSA
jgi:hypothetical protein